MKYIKLLSFGFLHLIAVGIIVYSFLPMAKWYFDSKILWGVDFFYTASITNLLKDNFVLPMLGWGYAWFTGWPLASNYPILTYYFIVPFTSYFTLLDSVKIWMLVTLALYFLGIYAVCYVLSKNYIISTLIAIAGIFSVGVYGALMWGGSLPNHATQAFFPWVLFFVILHLQRRNVRYMLVAAALTGLAIWSHPQIVIAYIYPSVAIVYFFSFLTIPFWQRIKLFLIFFGISFLIGLPLLYSSIGSSFKTLIVTDSYKVASSTAKDASPSQIQKDIIAFHMKQPLRIVTDSNKMLFVLLPFSFVFFFFSLVVKGRLKSIAYTIPYVVLAIYFVVYIWMFAYGISIYHGGWYRLFWSVPLSAGMLIAAFWGASQTALGLLLRKFKFIDLVVVSILSIGVGLYMYTITISDSKGIHDRIEKRSQYSSAFPDKLSMRQTHIGFEALKKEMIPSWIDGQNTDYRLYTPEQTINIWWNSLYKMPLARGYLDPWFPDNGYAFLVDASLNQDTKSGEDQLAGVFKYPPEIAFNNTLTLVDWYSIKYFEAGPTAAAYNPLPKSITSPEYIDKEEEFTFNEERYTKTNQVLHYYKLKDEFVTPILSGTNAKTIGIVASDGGYETIIRGLADMKLTSQNAIPIKLGRELDTISSNDLLAMDSLILYDYTYKNKGNAFKRIEEYVQKGKNVFVDTGVEVKESYETQELPSVFPLEKTQRKSLGTEWEFEVVDQTFFENADISKFDPPRFDKDEWKLSFPQSPSDVRSDANVILKNYKNPIVVSQQIGDGKVIWSGLNLPYHVVRFHNKEEVSFYRNIIKQLIPIESAERINSHATFVSPQNRELTTSGVTGVLFKEQAFPGWSAHLKTDKVSQDIKIYKAGPANPGFMYVRIPPNYQEGEMNVTFHYSGSKLMWVLVFTTGVVLLLIFDEVILGGNILGRLRKKTWKKTHSHVKMWWVKEDEE